MNIKTFTEITTKKAKRDNIKTTKKAKRGNIKTTITCFKATDKKKCRVITIRALQISVSKRSMMPFMNYKPLYSYSSNLAEKTICMEFNNKYRNNK